MRNISIYHANARFTGSAAKFALPEESHKAISVRIARQKATEGFPSFDWDDAVEVTLGVLEVAEILQVLRGECESIADGKGIFVKKGDTQKTFRMDHLVEPVPCYSFSVFEKNKDGVIDKGRTFYVNTTEALALCLAFEGIISNWMTMEA